jgi:hypothetical protein
MIVLTEDLNIISRGIPLGYIDLNRVLLHRRQLDLRRRLQGSMSPDIGTHCRKAVAV